MPSIDTRARKSVFQGKRARKELETWLRMICAPILSTEGRKIKKKTGLVVNINRTNKIDERFDLLLDITAMGPPAVPRDSELITAKIKEELVRYFGDGLNIGGWVRIGAEAPRWFSTYMPSLTADEILSQREGARVDPTTTILDFLGGDIMNCRRGINSMALHKIVTVADLLEQSEDDLYGTPEVGPITVAIIQMKLATHGLSLAPNRS